MPRPVCHAFWLWALPRPGRLRRPINSPPASKLPPTSATPTGHASPLRATRHRRATKPCWPDSTAATPVPTRCQRRCRCGKAAPSVTDAGSRSSTNANACTWTSRQPFRRPRITCLCTCKMGSPSPPKRLPRVSMHSKRRRFRSSRPPSDQCPRQDASPSSADKSPAWEAISLRATWCPHRSHRIPTSASWST